MTADYCFSHANEYLTAIIPLFSNSKNNSPQCMSTQSKLYRSARKREAREKLMRYSEDQLLSIYSFPITLAILFFTVFSPPNSPISGTNCFRRFSCDHADSYPVAILKAFLGVREDWGLGWGARETESVARELCKWKIYWADAGAMKD